MKKTIEIKQNADALVIPAEIVSRTSLLEAGDIDAYGTNAALLLLGQEMTPMEIVQAADMLHNAVRGLCDRLKNICQAVQDCSIHVEYAPDGVHISLSKALLESAGFCMNTLLDIDIDDGELYIHQACEEDEENEGEEDDPLEQAPDFLLNIMEDRGVSLDTLGYVLQMEEKFRE